MYNLKFVSWNVNGIRAGIRKGFWENISTLDPDFVCLQELKCQDEDMESIFATNLETKNLINLNNNLGETLFEDSGLQDSQNELNSQAQKVEHLQPSDFIPFWHTCRMKKGYSGTAIFVNKRVLENQKIQIIEEFRYLGDDKFDLEGRLIGLNLKIGDQLLFLLNGYYPQGGREGRVVYKCEFYSRVYSKVKQMQDQGYQVILCGDLNTTIADIDLARPKENRKTTGCLPEERLALQWLIDPELFGSAKLIITNPELEYLNLLDNQSLELIDSFRKLYPEQKDAYSYWDQITRARERNVGWRIDYWLLDRSLENSLKSATIANQIMGSDHCPVLMDLEL